MVQILPRYCVCVACCGIYTFALLGWILYLNELLKYHALQSNWGDYRLGDYIMGFAGLAESETMYRSWADRFSHDFQGSIAHEYALASSVGISTHRQRFRNFGLLRHIAEGRLLPGSQELVVHLRLGDVIQYSQHTPEEIWFDGKTDFRHGPLQYRLQSVGFEVSHYNHGMKYHEQLVASLGKNVTSVCLVGSFAHLSTSADKSRRYRDYVLEFYATKFEQVRVRWNSAPDDDLVFMCHAQHLLISNSKFGVVAGECARNRGAAVWPVNG